MTRYMLGVILVAILLSTASVSLAQQATPEPQRESAQLLERGRYLVETAAFCGVCHATRSPDRRIVPGMELAGGFVMAERGFRAVVPNITSDPETGIGRWTDSQIALAIRDGRRPDGSIIGPPMPIELYRGLSDRDLAAMSSLPAHRASGASRRHGTLDLPKSAPSLWSASDECSRPGDDPLTRGAYLAGPVAHCTICHTPRLSNGLHDWSHTGAGGPTFEGPWGVVASRNITSDKEYGIGAWTDEQIIRAITQGVSTDGRQLAPPMGARGPVYARLTARDLQDLVAYLRSLPPQGP